MRFLDIIAEIFEITHPKVYPHMTLFDTMKRKVKYYYKTHEKADCYDSLIKHNYLL